MPPPQELMADPVSGGGALGRSGDELPDRSRLCQFPPRHLKIQIAVMFDRISADIQQCGVPVAESLMSLGRVDRKTDKATGDIEFRVSAGEYDHWSFCIWSVVPCPGFRQVNDRGIVEHGSITLGNRLQTVDQCADLLHV